MRKKSAGLRRPMALDTRRARATRQSAPELNSTLGICWTNGERGAESSVGQKSVKPASTNTITPRYSVSSARLRRRASSDSPIMSTSGKMLRGICTGTLAIEPYVSAIPRTAPKSTTDVNSGCPAGMYERGLTNKGATPGASLSSMEGMLRAAFHDTPRQARQIMPCTK